jgi:hypothetical protein
VFELVKIRPFFIFFYWFGKIKEKNVKPVKKKIKKNKKQIESIKYKVFDEIKENKCMYDVDGMK